MTDILEIAEGTQYQTSDERQAYTITTTNWVSSPTSPSVTAYDESANDKDVTSTVYPTNSPSVSSDVITLSLLRALTRGHTYRIEVQFTVASSIYECFFRVKCTK